MSEDFRLQLRSSAFTILRQSSLQLLSLSLSLSLSISLSSSTFQEANFKFLL